MRGLRKFRLFRQGPPRSQRQPTSEYAGAVRDDGAGTGSVTAAPATVPQSRCSARSYAGRVIPEFINEAGTDCFVQPAMYNNGVVLWSPADQRRRDLDRLRFHHGGNHQPHAACLYQHANADAGARHLQLQMFRATLPELEGQSRTFGEAMRLILADSLHSSGFHSLSILLHLSVLSACQHRRPHSPENPMPYRISSA